MNKEVQETVVVEDGSGVAIDWVTGRSYSSARRRLNVQSGEGDNCSFRHDMNKRTKSTQPNPSPGSSTKQSVQMHREPEDLEVAAQVGKWLDCRARISSKELAQLHSVKNGIIWSACSTSRKRDADLGIRALTHTARLKNSPAKRSKKNGDKSAVAFLKNTRQLDRVFQGMEPPKSSSILRKSSNILKPIRFVPFTKAVLRHTKIRDQNPSLGIICPGDPHQRNPNAPKFEDRSLEETEWQEGCAREAAWMLSKNILKLKEKHETTFFSLSENWCLPSPSTIKPEEREFVVDSGESMHMISKKDLNSAELETLTTSRSPTTVITADGEVQTNEEATVYVRELDVFLTTKLLRGYASSSIAEKALR